MFKKILIAVLLVAAGFFAIGTAQAAQIDGLATVSGPAVPSTLHVFTNPGGLGDALVYPYYNARGAWNFFRVVNTDTVNGVAAKVRFREGKNSNEILDFYICLSAGDQWSAWVIDDGNSAHPATLVWYDNDTPTFPDPDGVTTDDATDNMFKSKDLRYGATGAASSVTASDTKEGYMEIIANTSWADVPGAAKVVKTPIQCGKTVLNPAEYATLFPTDPYGPNSAHEFVRPALAEVNNVLAGDATIFNVAAVGTYAYNATALGDFTNVGFSGSLGLDSTPRLSDSQDGLPGVNFVLTKAQEFAPYEIESGLLGGTLIVNTFPTKMLSIQQLNGNGPFNDGALYNDPSNPRSVENGGDGRIVSATDRCEDIGIVAWDDAENTPNAPTCDFSPCTPVTTKYQKCDEVSLFAIGEGKSGLTSTLIQDTLDTAGFDIGWVMEDFTTVAGRSTTFGTAVTAGLPVISYELQDIAGGLFSAMLPLQYNTIISAD